MRVASVSRFAADVDDAAGHPGREVLTDLSEHDDHAAGHVLARVIANAFDDSGRAAVANGEPLTGEAGDEEPSAGCAVKRSVSGEHLIGAAALASRRRDHNLAAVHAFAEPVVGVADQREPHSGRQNAPKLWPALPIIASCTEPSATPRSPKRAAIAPAMPAPNARSVLAIGPAKDNG